ncbi:MAG: HEPN domain-containing protein [Armatimonadota bacterium]|nr:HEPN domain-containing protein [Armatimonadota bacterium]
MSQDAELIRHRLQRAREALAEASALLDVGFTTGVVNRTYYACSYAVNALLLSKGLSSAKHSGVLSLFSQRVRGIVISVAGWRGH